MVVEGRKHVEEQGSVQSEQSGNWFWVGATWVELDLDGVDEDDAKLDLKKVKKRKLVVQLMSYQIKGFVSYQFKELVSDFK